MSDTAEFTVRLIDKVKGPAKSATRAVKGLDDGLKMVGRSAKSSGGFLGGALDVFKGNLLTSAVNKVADVGMGIAAAAGELLTFGQNSRMAFQQLAKHGAHPETLFEHARELAKRFGLDVLDTTKQYSKFLALQFNPAQADKMIRMGADLRALGADAEGVQGVFMALGQIKGKGRLQGEEMLQLAERGVSTVLVQEEIGKLMGGKDNKQVQKLMQAGKVTAEIGLQAIENAIKRKLGESELGEAGAKFADGTVDGILGRFKALAQDTGLRVLERVAGPLTDSLGGLFAKLDKFIDTPEGAATIDRMAESLSRAAEGVGTWLAQLDEKKIAGWFDSLANAVSVLENIGAALQMATNIVGFFGDAFGVVGRAIGEGLAFLSADFIIWFDGVKALFTSQNGGFWEIASGLGAAIVDGLVAGLKTGLKLLIGPATWELGVTIKDTLANALGIHSPSRVTMDMGWNLGRGMEIGMDRSSDRVASASADMGRASIESMGPVRASSGDLTEAASSVGNVSLGGITVHVQGGGDAQEIGDTVATTVRREVESLFRSLAMEV
jgi:tape measure domain-containing protein